jgi:phospholipase C
MGKIPSAIEHVVVLMFENRSFDHIFGAVPGVNGVLLADGSVNPAYFNLPNPLAPPDPPTGGLNQPVHLQGVDTSYQLAHDFNHDFGDGMMPDLFGPGTTGFVGGKPVNAPKETYPATNSGFFSTICWSVDGQPVQGQGALTFFEYGKLKVLHTLADAFVVCDNWHCDMPGHTMPNRAFMHCATTGTVGIADGDVGKIYNASIFDLIEGTDRTWKIYAPNDHLDTNWMNDKIRKSPNTGIHMKLFAKDAQAGTLPFYSFLMCWTGNGPKLDSSMHPASPIQAGENLLAWVYNSLRESPSWEKTLFVVTFDENGGMYDHVVPPTTVQPNAGPAQKYYNSNIGAEVEFDYTLLGPRIPALLISPWLRHGVDSTLYQNTSVLRFLEDWMTPVGEKQGDYPVAVCLTSRDATSESIAAAFGQFGLDTARKDTPYPLPSYQGYAWQGGPEIETSAQEAAEPPMPHMLEVARMYLTPLPGHADSGRPITREFRTVAELDGYIQERNEAARRYDGGAR